MPKKRDEEEELLNISDASHIIDCSPSTVRNLEARGLLPAMRTRSGLRLFKLSDVQKAAKERAAEKEMRRRKGPKAARPAQDE
jgi:DNA-binding transcriptional MerR regulator